jgi:hypothetical protein
VEPDAQLKAGASPPWADPSDPDYDRNFGNHAPGHDSSDKLLQCFCRETWSGRNPETDTYTRYPNGGCHNPDNDYKPWCFTKNKCGVVQRDPENPPYVHCNDFCFNHFDDDGLLPGSGHGCPAQVYCRSNTTQPKVTKDYRQVFGGIHDSCWGIDFAGVKEPCYCSWNCASMLLGLLGLCCVCCCGRCCLRYMTKYEVDHRASLGLAVAKEAYLPGPGTHIQLSLLKNEVVEVLEMSRGNQEWWEVSKLTSSEKGFVPHYVFNRIDPPPSRFRPPGTVLGAQEVLTTVDPNENYFLGPDHTPGGRNRVHRHRPPGGVALRHPPREGGAQGVDHEYLYTSLKQG